MDENTPRDARCEESDDTPWGMMRIFFSRALLPMVLFVWLWAIVFIAGAVYCGVRFFRSDQTRLQIAFAAGFVCFVQGIWLIKILGWQLIHKRSLSLKIKRLAARIDECIQACKR